MTSFWTNVRTCIGKYACFRGRASRSEFWVWMLFVVLVAGVLFGAAVVLVTIRSAAGPETPDNPLEWISGVVGALMILLGVFLLFCLLPTLAAGVRRLRDAGCRPWLLAIPIVLLIGTYHPLLDLTLSGMDDTPLEIPFWLSCGYLALTAIVCLIFAALLFKKSLRV